MGSGTYKNDANAISSISLEFRGQATNDGNNIEFLDWDGWLSGVAYMTRKTIQAVQLTDLVGVKSGAGFVFTANGKGQYSENGGAYAAKNVKVVIDTDKNTIKITDSDNGDAVIIDGKTGVLNAGAK